ncbi:hypothetical protein D3C72_1767040 [compost metagenome]
MGADVSFLLEKWWLLSSGDRLGGEISDGCAANSGGDPCSRIVRMRIRGGEKGHHEDQDRVSTWRRAVVVNAGYRLGSSGSIHENGSLLHGNLVMSGCGDIKRQQTLLKC